MIGYYVHHQGAGHLHRAAAIARHTRTPVTGLSSLPRPDSWTGPWIDLPLDTGGTPTDPEAGGRLHWAPVHHAGLRTRMGLVARWIEQHAPTLFVSDVSVEMACMARLMGVPVAVAAMRGERLDPAHRLAYDLADALLAPWPAALPEPHWLPSWRRKTTHTGAFSRFDQRPRSVDARPHDRPRLLVMLGAGGADVTAGQLREAVRATPHWSWTVLDRTSWTPDPWPLLCAADVVVTHGGQNAIAECAAARRPAVVIPQDRPYGEQHATARALAAAGLAVVRHPWPEAGHWPALLDTALAMNGEAWSLWSPGDGARRAAHLLDGLAVRPTGEAAA
ncbi:UDP-N-acetylglucosamine--N-acetylmuramyl-(pentapeptide) pyrophosphoryl-undecaprenol N-acetylglucosamine transferase [Streptacidiphilus sp. PB12-B1b]|uniref:glycosyltransferase n=1 Tax=Streptacidiphilus sp. PB12-B1b TaxID=2705012 RepID=UPI0015FB328D|nr:glycosyltransferase [Streptacidiphilus sp. PB12-B1b]QMU76837.1 UDP-N-acetylglucosamine--N-acetylmuramyl-(pentapeptide) pyrophosphoryl-undecaprenol N-acetylglucosamine transferase [Streptacidiphilus sp. PB12-B1b]